MSTFITEFGNHPCGGPKLYSQGYNFNRYPNTTETNPNCRDATLFASQWLGLVLVSVVWCNKCRV